MKFSYVVRAFMLVAAFAVVFSAVDAQAGLFNRGNDCCEPEPCCDPCDPCCDEGGFLSRLRDRGDDCCCEPEPCCEAEPAPCCEAEPAPCCEAEPVACCEPEPCCDPCDPCCEEGGFLSRLRGFRSKDDCCCEAEPACGCEAEPVVADCGCNG